MGSVTAPTENMRATTSRIMVRESSQGDCRCGARGEEERGSAPLCQLGREASPFFSRTIPARDAIVEDVTPSFPSYQAAPTMHHFGRLAAIYAAITAAAGAASGANLPQGFGDRLIASVQ